MRNLLLFTGIHQAMSSVESNQLLRGDISAG